MSNTAVPQVNIDSILQENRKFEPPAEFSRNAHIKSLEEYEKIYKQAAENPEEFWAGIAKELHWFKPWTKVLEWDAPWAKWFVGAETNISYNCLDRHVLERQATQSGLHLGRRARRCAYPYLSAALAGDAEVCQCS